MPGVVLTLLQLALSLSPLLLLCWLERRWSGGERGFITCAELLSLVPGWPGSMLRKAFYRATLRACALRAYIGFGAVVGGRTAEAGEGTWIGEGAIVLADVGRYAVVGAGAVVVRPVADGVTVVGNPARPVRGSGASEPVSSRVAAARGDRTVR
ncbi:MAG: hypothetical protein U0807_16550 [Candidatus Binatia bacterium]